MPHYVAKFVLAVRPRSKVTNVRRYLKPGSVPKPFHQRGKPLKKSKIPRDVLFYMWVPHFDSDIGNSVYRCAELGFIHLVGKRVRQNESSRRELPVDQDEE